MNIRYELMYKYICYQEEKERNKLLQELQTTDDKLDIQARLFLMDSIIMKFRFMQQDDNEKTNFFIQYVCNGNELLTTELIGDLNYFDYKPGEILRQASLIAADYGITSSSYTDDYATYYNFSVNLLEEKKTKQGHVQTLTQRKKNR